MTFRAVSHCRVCGSGDLIKVLDLGQQPLANGLLRRQDQFVDTYPLKLMACCSCQLAQLSIVVDPSTLYAEEYLFQSGISSGWVEHCQALADGLSTWGKKILEIGSNDGTLLKMLKHRGAKVLGVDPAASHEGAIREFWDEDVAARLVDEHGPQDKVIVQNVIGHVDDPVGFLAGINLVLAVNGSAVIEAPYLPQTCKVGDWPQVYHEHLSYWSIGTMMKAAEKAGMTVVDYSYHPVHNGSMRYVLKQEGYLRATPGMRQIWSAERSWAQHYLQNLRNLQGQMERDVETLKLRLSWAKSVIAYGASAKATVLLNAVGEVKNLLGVIDDTAAKQGRFIPGVGLEVLPPHRMEAYDGLLLAAYNWGEAIAAKAGDLGFTGEVIYPLNRAKTIAA